MVQNFLIFHNFNNMTTKDMDLETYWENLRRADIEHFAYVPYSIRNNIKDEKLWQVLNYLERVTWWDILCEEWQNESSITNAANWVNIRVGHYMDCVHIDDGNFQVIYESTLDIFYWNYVWVLPYIKTFLQKNAKKTRNS